MTKPANKGAENAQKVRGRPFVKGGPGGPGRAAISPDVRAALAADTLPRYERLKRMSADAEAAGDLKTASHIELALLKKTVPDATELIISMPEGLTVRTLRLDPKKLTKEQLSAIHAAQSVAGAP